MAAVTLRFVYMFRKLQDITNGVKSGEFLSLSLIVVDSSERPRKFPSYIPTRLSFDIIPNFAKEHPLEYLVRRLMQDGFPTYRTVV